MPREARRHIGEPEALEALAHPVRLDLINYLMSSCPATASTCARAVRDTPSNCSYHLRVLAKHGLVDEVTSGDGRERPWQALVTGFDTDVDSGEKAAPAAARLIALSMQRDQKLARDYLGRRDRVPAEWRSADAYHMYTLRLSPDELNDLGLRIDALIRPYIGATREQAPTTRPSSMSAYKRSLCPRKPGQCCSTRRTDGRRTPPARDLAVSMPLGKDGMTALRVANFRRLWLAGLVSDTGDWLLLAALPVLVYQLTGSTPGTTASRPNAA